MLYTGQGDKGTSNLFGCSQNQRISKDTSIFEALGGLDELNSWLGLCSISAESADLKLRERSLVEVLTWLQDKLFSIQAELGGADKELSPEDVKQLESWIAEVEEVIPPIRSFIVPGGSELAVRLDVGRTLARRVERRVISALKEYPERLKEAELTFLNRLSSLLFALARLTNYRLGLEERAPKYDR